MKNVFVLIIVWAAIAASVFSCNRVATEQYDKAARDAALHADFNFSKMPMVYKEPKHILHEVAGKLSNEGYNYWKYSDNFKIGVTRALQQFQYDNGLLMADLANSGKLCPLTAKKLDIAIY